MDDRKNVLRVIFYCEKGGYRMNHCIFLGRLTKDPEIHHAKESQIPIARFSIAVDRFRRKEGEANADFFPCVLFDKKAEFAEKYLCSGMRILISGNLQNRNYTNRAGEKVYGVELIGEDVEFADGKREKNEPQQSGQMTGNAQTPKTKGLESKGASGTSAASGMVKNGRSKPNANQQTSGAGAVTRSASSRNAGKTQSQRYSGRAAAGDFMNIPNGIEEEGLPFN